MSQSATGDLLEFLYICFSLGFRGRYKVAHQGQDEFEQIYRRLHHVLHGLRGDAPFPLLHQDKNAERTLSVDKTPDGQTHSAGQYSSAGAGVSILSTAHGRPDRDILHQLNRLLAVRTPNDSD